MTDRAKQAREEINGLRERVKALTQALREADFLFGGMATADTLVLVNAWREAARKLVEK